MKLRIILYINQLYLHLFLTLIYINVSVKLSKMITFTVIINFFFSLKFEQPLLRCDNIFSQIIFDNYLFKIN